MSSRQSRLLASTDLESFPTLYVADYIQHTRIILRWPFFYFLSKDHYVFCYEVLARYVDEMDIYANFKAVV